VTVQKPNHAVSRTGIGIALFAAMSHRQELNDSAGARVFANAREREEEIERAAAYTGRLIRDADSESRFELTEAATAIMREEALSGATNDSSVHPPQGGPATARRPLNPLSAGIGLVVIGGGIFFLVPFLGIGIVAIGLIAVLWGLIISAR
jgi:hypothetical protein